MSNSLVGLENLPNVYIKKTSLHPNNSDTFKVDVEILMLDIQSNGDFMWSDDDLISDYLKIAVIATSNVELISKISEGLISPIPSNIRRSIITPNSLMTGTTIIETSVKEMMAMFRPNSLEKRYQKRISFLEPVDTSTMTLFAFTYIDAKEMSKALRISLTGPLSSYHGSITSDNVIEAGEVVTTTYIYKETSGNLWTGPVHRHTDGRWMAGSYHSSDSHPRLVREAVLNTKIIDKREGSYSLRSEMNFKQKATLSELSLSYNNAADAIGMFSIDVRNLVLTKTKYGRKMFNVSKSLFESFSRSIQLNSLEIRRQQVKLAARINRLGTRKYNQTLIGSYKTVEATTTSNERLIGTDRLSQIYIVSDPLIKTYQYIDEEMSERTRGEYRYEAVITFIDKSQIFLRNLLAQMESNISNLKVQREFLFRTTRYDRVNDSLKPGIAVSNIFSSSIENYYQNLSILMDIDDETKSKLIKDKRAAFTTDNYTNRESERFISDYSSLASRLTRRFDIQKKTERLLTGSKPSRALPPGFITIKHVFSNTVKFDNVVASYDFLGIQSNKSLVSLTKDQYIKRGDLEVSRFFDTNRSTTSTDLADLDKEDMMAIKDLSSSKVSFFSPLSFKYKSQSKDLTSLQNLDTNGISINFITHMSEKKSNPQFSSAAVRKEEKSQAKPTKAKNRRVIKKRRFGRSIFNFKRTPFKINNLKPEEYLEVSRYLGQSSEMVNVESNLDEAVISPQSEQVMIKLATTNGLSVKREKATFDLQTKNNIFEKFKSSPKFDRKKLTMMPISIKALITSRSTAAKNNILESDSDILKDAETKIATEMIFHATQKVQYFSGFEMDSNGLPDISQPKWEDITPISLERNSRLLCRMRYTQIPELGIGPAPELKLMAQNEIFVISDEALATVFAPTVSIEQSIDLEQEIPEVQDIVYASSNYVKQNSSRRAQLMQSTTQPMKSRTQSIGGTANAQSSRY